MIKKTLPYVLIVLILVVAGTAFYLYRRTVELKKVSEPFTQEQTQTLIQKVGTLITLPTGETPTIATVTDLEKLQGQQFFAKAKVGDILIMYARAKKAYLYDPVGNKILETGPIVFEEAPQL